MKQTLPLAAGAVLAALCMILSSLLFAQDTTAGPGAADAAIHRLRRHPMKCGPTEPWSSGCTLPTPPA